MVLWLSCPKCASELSFWREGLFTLTYPFKCSHCGSDIYFEGPVRRTVFGMIIACGISFTVALDRFNAYHGDREVPITIALPVLISMAMGAAYSVWFGLRLFCRVKKIK